MPKTLYPYCTFRSNPIPYIVAQCGPAEVNTKERARSPKDRQGKGQANSAALLQLFAKICRLETSL
jgi:hypothetical protein